MSAPVGTAIRLPTHDQTFIGRRQMDQIANLEQPTASMPKANVTDPMLTRFYKEKTIDPSFAFNPAQEATLRNIFSRWHLDSSLTLSDLLGLEIYEEFSQICGTCNDKEQILETVSLQLVKILMLCYRSEVPVRRNSEKFVLHYFGNLDESEKKLKEAFQELKSIKKSSFLKFNDPVLRSKLISRIDVRMDHVLSCIDLYTFCHRSEYALPLLLKSEVSFFAGYDSFDSYTSDTLAHFKVYTAYCDVLVNSANKSGKVLPYCSLSSIALELQQPAISLVSTPEKILKRTRMYERMAVQIASHVQLIAEGKMTYDQWLQVAQIKKSNVVPKSREELFESLLATLLTVQIGLSFLKDFHRLLEFTVLRNYFPNQYFPRSLILNRLAINISLLKLDRRIEDQDPFRAKFRKELDHLFYSKCPYFDNFNTYSESLTVHMPVKATSGAVTKKMKSVVDLDVELIDPEIADNIEHFASACSAITDQLPAVIARLQKDEVRPIETLQKISFEECAFICRLAMIFRDSKFLLGSEDLDTDIPQELADLIQLEGYSLESPKTPSPEPVVPAAAAPAAAPAPIPQTVQTLAAVASSSPPPVEPFTLGSRNLRKVLQKLQQVGFVIYRTRGHHILKKNAGGASVVVPTHSEDLKAGTLKSIEKQARSALGEEE
jgi:predicted RNA binding protein YcfA (HicA-like mRNA interferase family)